MACSAPSGPQIQSQITPHAIIFLPDTDGMEMLLCYEDEGVYVNTYGRIIKDVVLQWGEMPTSVGEQGACPRAAPRALSHRCSPLTGPPALLPQPTSAPTRSWAGARKPLRSAQWRRATWTASSCTNGPRGSSSCASGTTRWEPLVLPLPSDSVQGVSPWGLLGAQPASQSLSLPPTITGATLFPSSSASGGGGGALRLNSAVCSSPPLAAAHS